MMFLILFVYCCLQSLLNFVKTDLITSITQLYNASCSNKGQDLTLQIKAMLQSEKRDKKQPKRMLERKTKIERYDPSTEAEETLVLKLKNEIVLTNCLTQITCIQGIDPELKNGVVMMVNTPLSDFKDEWTRLSTFKDYPQSDRLSTVLLAHFRFVCIDRDGTKKVKCCDCSFELGDFDDNQTAEWHYKRCHPNSPRVANVPANTQPSVNPVATAMFPPTAHENTSRSGASIQVNNLQEQTEEIHDEALNNQQEQTEEIHDEALNNQQEQTEEIHDEALNILQEQNVHTDNENRAAVNNPPSAGSPISSSQTYLSRIAVNRNLAKQLSPDLGIYNERPKHTEYVSLKKRIQTFKTWPNSGISHVDLAKSGFYYKGIKDHLTCFFCGMILSEWKQGDDPFVEHARWYPQCRYIRQHKGQAFVDAVCQIHETKKSDKSVITRQDVETFMGKGKEICSRYDEPDITSDVAFQILVRGGYQQDKVYTAAQEVKDAELQLSTYRVLQKLLENRGNSTRHPARHTVNRRIEKLKTENDILRNKWLCKICLQRQLKIVFMPCAHLIMCQECAVDFEMCPSCGMPIEKYLDATL
ncbi:baculoviral IAP repeat-containing protein 3-like [Physella acuta]|uniref:baculoviral IAP repeat-containing protein 3-like n=1 Tax=Physella acuta TaxID=109671 RepID=UPI0027DDD610|nr:baculoviral IAP repeat-containing protein 3-like [Physella acuta]